MIRCVRLWTGEDQNSHAEEGFIDLEPGARGDFLTGKLGTSHASFQETRSGGTFEWHTAPVRQLVITLERHARFPDARRPALHAGAGRDPAGRGYDGRWP